MEFEIVRLNTRPDKRGNLTFVESLRDIPFEIKRIFYIWDNRVNHPRGGHAHKNLWQGLIAVHGSCRLVLDDGGERQHYELSDPRECVIIRPGVWGEQVDFSQDCVLLVLASEHYDESDYIRNYDEYLEYARSH